MTKLVFESYKSRQVQQGDCVHLYRNLHAESLSIRVGTLVHAHAMIAKVHNATFLVSERGNERTRIQNQRNVHAYVRGDLEECQAIINDVESEYQRLEAEGYTRIYYNPYKVRSFVIYGTQEPVFHAYEAVVIMDRVYIK